MTSHHAVKSDWTTYGRVSHSKVRQSLTEVPLMSQGLEIAPRYDWHEIFSVNKALDIAISFYSAEWDNLVFPVTFGTPLHFVILNFILFVTFPELVCPVWCRSFSKISIETTYLILFVGSQPSKCHCHPS